MRNFYFIISLFFCVLVNAQSINLFNPSTNVNYPDQQYFCAGEQFNLKVDAVATSTGDYSITQLTGFNVPAASTNVPFTNRIGNDHFSQPINIPFAFEFYGKQYSKVVVGSNGRLLFGSDAEFSDLHASRYIDKVNSGNNTASSNIKIPSSAYNQIDSNDFSKTLNYAQIFFGYTDLGYYNIADYNKLTYGIVTYNGQQGLLINFNQVMERTVGSGYDTAITSQVLLLANDQILIKVVKPNATKNAIIGMQNEMGTAGRWPINSEATSVFNNDKWSSNGSSSWTFTPNLNLTPRFKWSLNGAPLPETSGALSNFAPNDGDVLKIEVTYHDPLGAQVGVPVSDDVTFTSLPTPTASVKSSTCSQSILETPLLPDMTYQWFQTGNPAVLSTTNQLTVFTTGSYFVRMKHISNAMCFKDSAPISVSFSNPFPPYNNSPKYICKTDGSTSTTVNLYNFFPANAALYNLDFQENGVNVSSYTNFPIDANTTITLNIVAQNTAGTCTFNDTLTLVFASLPVVGTAYSPTKTCSPLTTYSATDFKTEFFPTINYDILFSTDGINYTLNSVNPSVNPSVFVKIKHPNFVCETTGTINFSTHPTVIANAPTTQLPPQCSSSFSPFHLTSLVPEINTGNVTITFHNSLAGAQSGGDVFLNDNSIGSKTVYIRVVDNATGCVSLSHPTITLLVYAKPTIVSPSPIAQSQCLGATFNLTQNPATLTNATAPITVTLEYYSANGTQLFGSDITNYNASVPVQNPYIKVIYNATCSDIIPFNLTYLPKPVAITTPILICAETTYPLQEFKNQVATNPSQYTFTDVLGNPLPANFNLSSLPLTVNFLMKDNTTGCVSDPQTVTFVRGSNSVLLIPETDYVLCDADFDGKTEFNLKSKESDFTGSPATFKYFKDALFDQKIENFTKYVNENPFDETVYVKITLPGFCPSIGKIHLKANTPTKSTTLKDKYDICFDETLTINAGDENTIFVWSDGQSGQNATFTETGNYSVILKNGPDGCPYTHNFTISDENQPKIEVINQTNNSIEVIASGGTKPYRYYFNGIPQTSNILQNPTESSYEIQVESATGCFGPPKTIYFIKINNAFTPNGDGMNDTWKIENLDKMQEVSIVIINRNGTKVFESTNPSKSEWDGKSNGRELPTSSYWYVVTWFDAVTQKNEQRQGWILLKNRN